MPSQVAAWKDPGRSAIAAGTLDYATGVQGGGRELHIQSGGRSLIFVGASQLELGALPDKKLVFSWRYGNDSPTDNLFQAPLAIDGMGNWHLRGPLILNDLSGLPDAPSPSNQVVSAHPIVFAAGADWSEAAIVAGISPPGVPGGAFGVTLSAAAGVNFDVLGAPPVETTATDSLNVHETFSFRTGAANTPLFASVNAEFNDTTAYSSTMILVKEPNYEQGGAIQQVWQQSGKMVIASGILMPTLGLVAAPIHAPMGDPKDTKTPEERIKALAIPLDGQAVLATVTAKTDLAITYPATATLAPGTWLLKVKDGTSYKLYKQEFT